MLKLIVFDDFLLFFLFRIFETPAFQYSHKVTISLLYFDFEFIK